MTRLLSSQNDALTSVCCWGASTPYQLTISLLMMPKDSARRHHLSKAAHSIPLPHERQTSIKMCLW